MTLPFSPPIPPAPSPLPSDRQFLFIQQHPEAGLRVIGSPSVPFLAALFHYTPPGVAHTRKVVPLRMINDQSSWFCDGFIPLFHVLTEAKKFGWRLDVSQVTLRADWPPCMLASKRRRQKRQVQVNALSFSKPAALTTRRFGVPLWRCMYTKEGAPVVLHKLLTHLSEPAHLSTPHLFAQPVDQHKIDILRERIDQGEDLNLYLYDAHAAAALLKDWLKHLQDPLIPSHLLPRLTPLITASYGTEVLQRQESIHRGLTVSSATGDGSVEMDTQTAMSTARDALQQHLPPHLMHLLALLTRFLRLVASQSSVNHMAAEKLGVIFGEILCKKEQESAEDELLYLRNRTVLSILIRYCISEWSALFETLSRPLTAPTPHRADSSATLFCERTTSPPKVSTTPVSQKTSRSNTPTSMRHTIHSKLKPSPSSSLRRAPPAADVPPSVDPVALAVDSLKSDVPNKKTHRKAYNASLKRLDTRPESLFVDEVSPPTTFLAADSDSDDDILPNCSISAVGKLHPLSPTLHAESSRMYSLRQPAEKENEDVTKKQRRPPAPLLLVRPTPGAEEKPRKYLSPHLQPPSNDRNAPSPALTAATTEDWRDASSDFPPDAEVGTPTQAKVSVPSRPEEEQKEEEHSETLSERDQLEDILSQLLKTRSLIHLHQQEE